MKFSSSDTNRLAETAMQVAGDHGYVVMVFCDSKYKRLLENWLLFAESHEEKFPILICALDDSLANEMTGRGYPACHVPWSGPLSNLWRIRVCAIDQVLSLGIDVAHSDVDAVWRSSPMPFLREHASSDIVASQGTIWPPLALTSWGHVLCFGFVYFKSTTPALWLLGQLATAVTKANRFDDQQSFNNLLIKQELTWESPDESYQIQLLGKTFNCYRQTISGRATLPDGSPIRASLLPHSLFQRLPNKVENEENVVVAHPWAKKAASSTETELRRINCWKLN